MECQFGIRGEGYVLLASDMQAARSIVAMKKDEDKMKVLGTHQVLAYNGEPGDTVQFAEYVQANLKLNSIRNHCDTPTQAAASWIRNSLASSLRSRKPYSVNVLLAGFDRQSSTSPTPSLYWIDYLGTMAEVPYAAHGYGSYFCLSTLDRYHDPSKGWEAGLESLKLCIAELQTRFIVNLGQWKVRIITADGIKEMILNPIPPPPGARDPSEMPVEQQQQQQPITA